MAQLLRGGVRKRSFSLARGNFHVVGVTIPGQRDPAPVAVEKMKPG
jgi:hypothetical protein